MEKRLCFGCLLQGHQSKSCDSRLVCAVCKRSHPTSLHGFTASKLVSSSKDSSKIDGPTDGTAVSKVVSAVDKKQNGEKGTALFANSAGMSKSTMIVPVFISSAHDPELEVLTYALLNTQSDTSFISSDICGKLGVCGVDTTLRLSTMTAEEKVLHCSRVNGLVVGGFDSQIRISMPPLYTHDCIPADQDCKPMIGHLMPKSNCGVGLLLGYNCPRALTPRDVIPSEGEGPFAQRTDLGWGIIGLVKDDSDRSGGCGAPVGDARIALRTSAKEVICPQEVYKFFGREEGVIDRDKFSQDDVKFMKLMERKPEVKFSIAENDPEVKRSVCLAVVSLDPFEIDFTSWKKARKIVAICLRFIQNLRSRSKDFISVDDLVKAEVLLVKIAQSRAFPQEINCLQNGGGKAVSKSSPLRKLDPFLDEKGVLRVGGRIKQGMLAFELKHPIILPKSHPITNGLVKHLHNESHQGRGITTNVIRNRGYWICGMSSIVSKIVFRCVTCRKYRRSPEGQKMGDIPAERLESVPPFSHVGADYFGPFYIRDGRKEVKRYGVLFTCLNSRAVHLETANSLEAGAFINAFRRLQSLRGPVRTLRCDRGTHFVGGHNELKQVQISDEKVRNYLLENQCDFIFNVPHASHQGGIWERQIRSIRNALHHLMSSQGHQLDDETFRTFMCEAANVVNSRPLTAASLNDPISPTPLTPNHLLTLKSNVVLPPPIEFQKADLYCRKRWRRVQYMADEF